MHNELDNKLACRHSSASNKCQDRHSQAGAEHNPPLVSKVSLNRWILPKPHHCMSCHHWTPASNFNNSANEWQLYCLPIQKRLLVPPTYILCRISNKSLANMNIVNNIIERVSKIIVWVGQRIYAKHIPFQTPQPKNVLP